MKREIMEGVLEALDIEDRASQIFEDARALRHGANGTFDEEDAIIAYLDAPQEEDEEEYFPDDEDAPEPPPYWDFEGEDGPDALGLSREQAHDPEDAADLVGRGVNLVAQRQERASGQLPFYFGRPMDDAERDNRCHAQTGGRKPRKVNRPRPEREARQQRRLGMLAAS